MRSHRWPLYGVLGACVLVVFLTLGPGWPARDSLYLYWGLSRESLSDGRWWTFLTHALMHGNWWHALFNLASLWVLGRHLCDCHGPWVFATVLGAGTVAGGIGQLLLAPVGILVGISGGVMAMITAAGFLWGDRMVGFGFGTWRFGRVKGSHLGWGILAAAWLFVLASPFFPESGVAIGHACHAAAALAGAVIAWVARASAPFSRPAPGW